MMEKEGVFPTNTKNHKRRHRKDEREERDRNINIQVDLVFH